MTLPLLAPTEPFVNPQDGKVSEVWYRWLSQSNTALNASQREKLTAARIYYVRTDGSDSNTGLVDSSAGAFLTIQHAIDVVRQTLDIADNLVTIQVGNGTYSENLTLGPVVGAQNGGYAYLRGDPTTPTNVVLSGTASTGTVYALGQGTDWKIDGFKITNSVGDGVNAHAGAWIRCLAINFGACANAHMRGDFGGTVEMMSNYTVSGNAAFHAAASENGWILNLASTVTNTGTPVFATAYLFAAYSSYISWGPAQSGAVTLTLNLSYFVTGPGSRIRIISALPGTSQSVSPGNVIDTTGQGGGGLSLQGNAALGWQATYGAGGTITQQTNKSTSVTLDTYTGQITMNGAALAADTTVSFTLTNNKIASGDVLVLNHISAGTAGSYLINAQSAAGSASINVRNITGGSLSEAIVIAFAVIKAVTS